MGKRGRAYKCLYPSCRFIDERGRMETHILKLHISPDRVPFLCTLCNFKCLNRDQYDRHLTKFDLHQVLCTKKNLILQDPKFCFQSARPYMPLADRDYRCLSRDESEKIWTDRKSERLGPAKLMKLREATDMIGSVAETCRVAAAETVTTAVADILPSSPVLQDLLNLGDSTYTDFSSTSELNSAVESSLNTPQVSPYLGTEPPSIGAALSDALPDPPSIEVSGMSTEVPQQEESLNREIPPTVEEAPSQPPSPTSTSSDCDCADKIEQLLEKYNTETQKRMDVLGNKVENMARTVDHVERCLYKLYKVMTEQRNEFYALQKLVKSPRRH